MEKPIRPHHKQRLFWLIAIAGGIAFMILCGFFFIQRGKKEIRQDVADTLEMVKITCQKYDDYQLGATIKDLYAAINKTNVLSLYSDREKLMDEEALKAYAQVQYLTGIVVFDGMLKQKCSIENDKEVTRSLWDKILDEGQVQKILRYPQAVVSDRVTLGDHSYIYAIVSRHDAPGVILCYSDTTQFKNDKYELSLDNMLDTDSLNNDEVLVVTDGEKVISSNSPSLRGLTVEECPITNVVDNDRMQEDATLIKLKQNGLVWYGMHAMYRDYYLYVLRNHFHMLVRYFFVYYLQVLYLFHLPMHLQLLAFRLL